ncbi:sn-glycerol-3-phosphate ABC transporter ATP-binding protein UgpC [Martelella mediterranea]|uniref:ABC transporter ATP-binding protein n=1 Tax=Martelella mediterranea TaxID=293089 RepID=UPI001E39ACA4|nr:sn-glycerol-3-phosphate ABC transporter ATP-binding protein UgpC [Martelella mediterranea]MCD1634765.1 sn-glycerol-3-phosphate ABC transporter ATP-binding protein UgpC [Martelella mediterranea]
MSTVELQSICKNFGRFQALSDINLSIAEGEFVVLVGPSGCGKSTLLRMIAGLETISSGTMRIGGEVVNDMEARERDIAMVFQSYALYPHFSVDENIGFPMKIRGESGEALATHVEETSKTIGMDALLHRRPRDLSGGQRQRVAMGRAIIRDPRVFLFDEPLSNLDAKLRVEMRHQIRQLHRRLGSTSIYVTHDQVEAMTLADRVVLLKDGEVQQVGPPMELYTRPANTFVAGFIGSPEMNFIDARIEQRDGRKTCVLADGRAAAVTNLPEGPVTLAIRPEDLALSETGIAGRVYDIEVLGSETHVEVDIGGTIVTCAPRGIMPLRLGETVHITPTRDKLHFFDKQSGKRLEA